MKTIKINLLSLTIFIVMVMCVSCDNTKQIDTGSLFEEMINMVNLAEYPDPGYKTIQYSSYDHRSTTPDAPDWFANSDGFGGEPIPNFEEVLTEPDENGIGEYLIADVDGPGAIVRVWTASINGEVKVYIDGEEAKFVPIASLFFKSPYDEEINNFDKIESEVFKKTINQRDASYAPIPFKDHLRVVWKGNINEIHFYQLQVRLYDKGTRVKSFEDEDLANFSEIINKVSLTLSDADTYLKPMSEEEETSYKTIIVASGKEIVFEHKGSKAIEVFSIKLQAENIDLALRQTLLQISFDGEENSQVQSPVGDFFGAAPGINPYQSLPFTVKDDGTMICRFVMPFKKSVKIELFNLGDQEVSAEGKVLLMPYKWNKNSMHFSAKWRTDHEIIAHNTDIQDIDFLLAEGKGVYVGTTSYLMNPAEGPKPYGNWWGEGDEKIFVDNEIEPSTFGTGSEDYYNYSWSAPDIFYFPYCGQPRNDGPGNRGFVTNYRYHFLDAIPFKENIKFFMELFHHEPTPGFSYSRIGYHYAIPGLTDDHEKITKEDVRELIMPENWTPIAVKGSRNSVFYSAEDLLINHENISYKKGRIWEGSNLLVWKPGEIGEKIHFNIPINQAGDYAVYINYAMSPSSGQISLYLDDVKFKNQDLYRPFRILSRDITSPTISHVKGKHTISIEYIGNNSNNPEPEIGIDFIWVQKL